MRALPVADLTTILGGTDPLVLAPHADDESLGCGGLIARCVEGGGKPCILVLTDGTGSHPHSRAYPAERLRTVREREVAAAAGLLGVDADRVGFMRLRDTAAPTAGPAFTAAVEKVAAAVRAWGCGVLLAPWRHDPHGDHVAAHLIAVEAARLAGVVHLAYPVWGWTLPAEAELDGPVPVGWRLDISRQLGAKHRAIAAHASQHSGLIDDDPSGFRLPPSLLAQFDEPYETFLSAP